MHAKITLCFVTETEKASAPSVRTEMEEAPAPSVCTEIKKGEHPSTSVIKIKDKDLELNLFVLDRPFPSDRGHFPSTLTSTGLKNLILSHGPCRPVGCFEKDEKTGQPVFKEKYYHYFTTGNLKVTVERLCFSPSMKKPYYYTCWLFADGKNNNFQWIDGVPELMKNFGSKVKTHESSSIHMEAAAVQ